MKRLALLFLFVCAPAFAQPAPVVMQLPAGVDANFALQLNAASQAIGQQTAAAVARENAKASAFAACMGLPVEGLATPAKDVTSAERVACLGFVAVSFGTSAGGAPPQTALALPGLPPEKKPPPTWVESVLSAPKDTLAALSQFAPSIVQYLITKVTTGSNERVAIAQSQERVGLYGVFGQMNQQGMNAIAATAQQGFVTIGQIPQGSTTNYNVSGSNGVGFGSGAVAYNAATNSYNRNCSGGAAAAGGAGGTGTPTVPGGAAGAGGNAPGGTC